MVTNYYTLFHIAVELNQEFSGLAIDELYTQHRGELVVSFMKTISVIIIGCEPADNFIYAEKSFARARRNSTNLFSVLRGKSIKKISLHPSDREIALHFVDGFGLVVQLFGSKANIFLCDPLGSVRETFLTKGDQQRAELRSVIDFTLIQPQDQNQSLKTVLKQSFPQFGPVLIHELLFRASLTDGQPWKDLDESEIDQLSHIATSLQQELQFSPSARIYFHDTSPVRLSIISLHSLIETPFRCFKTVSSAIQSYRADLYHEKSVLKKKDEIIKILERELEHVKHIQQKIEKVLESPDRADQYEKYGKLLMAQMHLVSKGDEVALLENYIDPSHGFVEISLDIHLTPAKNAERYFEKSKKSRRTIEEQHRRLSELGQQHKNASLLLSRIEDVVTSEDLKLFIEECQKSLRQYGLKIEKSGQVKKETPLPFRVFTIVGGFQVWAGKSSETNDLLSTRHTAKNDLWFHARGVGGSHVVLKKGTGRGEVSKQAIEQAAAIAAYYSKMKKSKFVPVTMCEGKYVRKPKGVPTGTVTVEREKTIFAEPRLPERESD